MGVDLGITKNGKTYSIDFLLHHNGGQKVLESWHKEPKNPPRCECTKYAPSLSVCHWDSSGRYSLRAYPRTKGQHHIRCRFGGFENPLNQESQFSQSALRIDENSGKIRITGTMPLKKSTGYEELTHIPCSLSANRCRYNKMTGLGFLQQLWSFAHLNYNGPRVKKIRNWEEVVRRIRALSTHVIYNRRPLHETLAYVGSVDRWIDKHYYTDAAAPFRSQPNKRFLAIFPIDINSFVEAKHGYRLNFMKGSWLAAFVSNDVVSEAIRKFELKQDDRYRYIAIGNLGYTENGYLKVFDLSALKVNSHFIPVDSSYELALANELLKQKREFSKPLKMKADFAYLPDFVLHDTREPTAIEVFGMMDNDDYREHAEVKISYYKEHSIPLWSWNPQIEPRIPKLPQMDNRANEN